MHRDVAQLQEGGGLVVGRGDKSGSQLSLLWGPQKPGT